MVVWAVLLSLLLNSFLVATGARCGEFCNFRWCSANDVRTVSQPGRSLLLRDGGIASNPFVCRRVVERKGEDNINEAVRVLKTGEAEVHPAKDRSQMPPPFVRISKYRPPGLKPRFPKDYFSLQRINFPPIPGEKGFARKGSVGNQEDFVDDLCVLIPIKSYTVMTEQQEEVKNVRTRERADCLSVRTIAPLLLVELTWNSGDDLDLSIREPNGNVIDFRKRKSSTGGRLIGDQNPGRCREQAPNGREQIRWLRSDSPESGDYKITIRHFENCGFGASTWSLAVALRGQNLFFKRKTSNKDDDQRTFQTTVTVKI